MVAGLAVVGRDHFREIRVPEVPRRDVTEDVLAAEGRQRDAAVDEPAGDRVTALGRVRIVETGYVGCTRPAVTVSVTLTGMRSTAGSVVVVLSGFNISAPSRAE